MVVHCFSDPTHGELNKPLPVKESGRDSLGRDIEREEKEIPLVCFTTQKRATGAVFFNF